MSWKSCPTCGKGHYKDVVALACQGKKKTAELRNRKPAVEGELPPQSEALGGTDADSC